MHTRTLCRVVPLLLAFAIALGSAAPSDAVEWKTRLELGSINTQNYDLALSSDRAHLVYEHDGRVFYATVTRWDPTWSVTEIGLGTTPSIAVAPDGTARVAFVSGGSVYFASSSSGWSPTLVAPGNYGSLGIDGTGTYHLLLEGEYDGDGYLEIALTQYTGSGWSGLEILQDGWYDRPYGNYFDQSSLAALPGSGYVYALQSSSWGGRASWSARYPSAVVPGGTGTAMEVGWNTGSELSRQAIAAGLDGLGFVFATNGTVFLNTYDGTDWAGFTSLGPGGEATVDMALGCAVAFQNAGFLKLFKDGSTEAVTFEGTELRGHRPFLAGREGDYFLLYRDEQGTLTLLSTAVIPEPGTVICLSVGALLLAFRRRKT